MSLQLFHPSVAPFVQRDLLDSWLIMDDASYDLPVATFWKGYESVVHACAPLPDLGFCKVRNVGHHHLFEQSL